MVELYELISDLCNKKGVSGGKMCADIGVSRSFMTELKKGRAKTITFATAQKLADYFNVNVNYFNFEFDKSPEGSTPFQKTEKAPDAETPRADERFEKMWAMYSSLSDEDKDAADKYLAFLSKNQKND